MDGLITKEADRKVKRKGKSDIDQLIVNLQIAAVGNKIFSK